MASWHLYAVKDPSQARLCYCFFDRNLRFIFFDFFASKRVFDYFQHILAVFLMAKKSKHVCVHELPYSMLPKIKANYIQGALVKHSVSIILPACFKAEYDLQANLGS